MARAVERARASRRHFSSLSRRDKVVLWIIVGVPTLIHVVFVWIPAISTIVLSFTNWNGIVGVGDIRFVGFRNYWEIFTVFEKDFWSAALDNGFLVVFLFLVPDGDRCRARLPARQEPARQRRVPEHLLHARRALARRRRVHLEERALLAEPRPVLDDPRSHRSGEPDRLARRPVAPDLVRQHVRHLQELRRHPHRHRLATHGIHHGALPRRAEVGRPGPARGGGHRRMHRVAGVPPCRVPGDEADQHRRRCHHGDRGAARLRHRVRPQVTARDEPAVDPRHRQPDRRGRRQRRAAGRPTG